MARAQKLMPVINLARRETDQAQQQLTDANMLFNQEQRQLQDLQKYRQDYLQRFRTADQQTMSSKKALELRAFLMQLDQAIQLQETQVQKFQVQVQHKQQLWQQARNKQHAMETLMERYQREEQHQQQRKEQLASDEFSAQLWRRKQP